MSLWLNSNSFQPLSQSIGCLRIVQGFLLVPPYYLVSQYGYSPCSWYHALGVVLYVAATQRSYDSAHSFSFWSRASVHRSHAITAMIPAILHSHAIVFCFLSMFAIFISAPRVNLNNFVRSVCGVRPFSDSLVGRVCVSPTGHNGLFGFSHTLSPPPPSTNHLLTIWY